jgi:hypothetical protein
MVKGAFGQPCLPDDLAHGDPLETVPQKQSQCHHHYVLFCVFHKTDRSVCFQYTQFLMNTQEGNSNFLL